MTTEIIEAWMQVYPSLVLVIGTKGSGAFYCVLRTDEPNPTNYPLAVTQFVATSIDEAVRLCMTEAINAGAIKKK